MGEQESIEPQRIELTASANFGALTSQAGLRVRLVDNLEVEDSSTLKLLRLRDGDFELYKRVFLVIDGEKYEITRNPEEVPSD